MQDNKIISSLKKDGFVKVTNLLDDDDSYMLKKKAYDLISTYKKEKWKSAEDFNYDFRVPIVETKDWAVLSNFFGLDHDIDIAMEKFFTNYRLKNILASCIGNDYKLWSGSIRLAKSKDDGLGFHTDSEGEIGISILLSNTQNSDATTSFIKGSHKWPIQNDESGISSIPRKLLQPFSTPATGKIGDVYIFFKKTYHGRMPHRTDKEGLCILLAPIASGYTFHRYNIDNQTLNKMGPELTRLMDDKNISKTTNTRNNEYYIKKHNNNVRYIDDLYHIKAGIFSLWKLLKLLRVLRNIKILLNRIFNTTLKKQ